MGVILTYKKNGKEVKETIGSYYRGVIRKNELKGKGYTVTIKQAEKCLVPREIKINKTSKELVGDFIHRANNMKNFRKHGIRERGLW